MFVVLGQLTADTYCHWSVVVCCIWPISSRHLLLLECCDVCCIRTINSRHLLSLEYCGVCCIRSAFTYCGGLTGCVWLSISGCVCVG